VSARSVLIEALARRLGAREPTRGLLRNGKASLAERISFLLSTGRDERNYEIGRYLDTRRTGGRLGRNGQRRTGEYNGAYAGGESSLTPSTQAFPDFGELSPREAQLARAEAIGFDTSRVFYRGSRSDESVARANPGTYDEAYYINRTPDRASEHAGIYEEPNGGNVIPVFVRRGKFKPTVGAEGLVRDGRDVRSIFAQFDPARADSNDLLAGLAIGVPAGGITLRELLLRQQEERA